MKITIETLPHAQQRYDTAGDWQITAAGDLAIFVSELGDPRYEYLVGLHELVEATLCTRDGITDREVDDFDMPWQAHDGLEEPGADPAAPYHWHHLRAEELERLMAERLGVDWDAYGKALEALVYPEVLTVIPRGPVRIDPERVIQVELEEPTPQPDTPPIADAGTAAEAGSLAPPDPAAHANPPADEPDAEEGEIYF